MANGYITLAEFKEEREVTDSTDDSRFQRAIDRASRAIDDRCSRRFYSDGVATERLMSVYGATIARRDGELLLTSDIATDAGLLVSYGNGVSPSHWTNVTSFSVHREKEGWPITGLLAASWYGGETIRVTADWGWPEAPEPIKEATLLLANRRFTRRKSPEGVAGWAQDGAVRVSRFDPDIEDLVQPYVLHGFGA